MTLKSGYNDYPVQTRYIEDIMESEDNIVAMEMPTGTGKTLCNLRAILSEYNELVYCSTSHEQLEQVITELKRLNYNNDEEFRCLHLAGRKHMCMRDDVLAETNEILRKRMCENYIKTRKCTTNLNKYKDNDILKVMWEYIKEEMTNMQYATLPHITGLAREGDICPRAMVTYLKGRTNITVLPTIYLFFQNAYTKGEVLVIDEAHNMAQQFRQMQSSNIPAKYLIEWAQLLPDELSKFYEFLDDIPFDGSLASDVLNLPYPTDEDMHIYSTAIESIKRVTQTYPPSLEYFGIYMALLQIEHEEPGSTGFIKTRLKQGYRIKLVLLKTPDLSQIAGNYEKVIVCSANTEGSFLKELGVTTVNRYPSPHKNALGFLTGGINGHKLTTKMKDRTDDMFDAYAAAIQAISSTNNSGTLVFATSYAISKRLFQEYDYHGAECFHPKQIDDYRDESKISRSIFFSALRGRGSEGINFPDHEARAIIICGVPYLYSQDPETKLYMDYLEENFDKETQKEWFMTQASIPVSQALGRGLRHPMDYCTWWLVDDRYRGIYKYLPHWQRDLIDIRTPHIRKQISSAKAFYARMRGNE